MTGISIVWPTHHCLQTTHMIGHHSLFRVGATFPGMLSGFTHTHTHTLGHYRRTSEFRVHQKPVAPSASFVCCDHYDPPLLCLCPGWWPNPAPSSSTSRQPNPVKLSLTMSWRRCIDPKRYLRQLLTCGHTRTRRAISINAFCCFSSLVSG